MKNIIHANIQVIWLFLLACLFSQKLLATPIPEGIQVYQTNIHLSEEHKQKLAADIYRYYKADNIWTVLRHEFILPHYEYMPQVQAQINWFLLHQDFLINSANRAAPYLYYILQQVHKRHLPAELVLLPIMESSYNPFAYSTKGAAGIWQIMPGTAAGFGVKQNGWYDGRRDIVTSTRTALDYLSYLGNFFGGNWLLAIAAYDTGEGNVFSAIKRNIRGGMSTDYWSLPLSQETRDYIPRLLALAIIIGNPDRYPILFPPVRNAPYLAQIDIGGQIDLKKAANLAGLSLKKMMHLNAGFNRGSTDPNGPYKLILPIENVQQFSENLEHSLTLPTTRWNRYAMKLENTSTSNPLSRLSKSPFPKKKNHKLAKRDNINNDILIISNKQSPIVSNNPNTIANTLANLEGKYSLQPGDTLYMIREGDDLGKIAKRFHIDSQTIVSVNQTINEDNLTPGEKIIIPTHLADRTTAEEFPTPGETIYRVKKGDSLDKVAQQFHTSPGAIRIANLLNSNQLQPGDRLVIPQVG